MLTIEERVEIILLCGKEGTSMKEVADAFNRRHPSRTVTQRTVRRLFDMFKAYGCVAEDSGRPITSEEFSEGLLPRKNKKRTSQQPSTSKKDQLDQAKIGQEMPNLTGFERNLEAEKILGAKQENGAILFYIKWKGSDHGDFVRACEAHKKIPQLVIDFYQSRLRFTDL